MKTLHFSIDIAAPARRVWDTMLQPATYGEWTAEFCPGSRYEGAWEQGATMRFLAPTGDGLHSRIAELRPHSFVSIQHLGEIVGGENRPAGDTWSGAFENYTLTERDGQTRLAIAMDVAPDFEAYMEQTWPKALARLKGIAERSS